MLADGSLITTDEEREPDLFWALRGGGGNFGVVTFLTLAMQQMPLVLNATILIPTAFAKAPLLGLQHLLDEQPNSLSILSSLLGERGLLLGPLWTGKEKAGEHYLDAIARFKGASVLAQSWSSYARTFDLGAEKTWPKWRRYQLDSRNIPRIDEEAAELLVSSTEAFTSLGSCLTLHDFNGASTLVAPGATAFPLRRNHFNLQMIAAWDATPYDNPD